MKKIRVGIIGQGRSGRDIHGSYLIKDERFQIMAVADLMPERRERAVAEYKCDAYADYHEMLKRTDIDLMVNATFSHLHVPVSLDCLKAGFNVLSEKPLAPTVKDVDTLIKTSEKTGKLLAIFQQSRYARYFRQVCRVVDSGVLGRIVQISVAFNGFGRRWDWQTLTEYRGGSLLNTGPHPLDQALVLFGDGMPKVTCFMDRSRGSFGDAENHVKLILSGEGHPLIDLEISSCTPYPCFTYNVYGTLGGMKATTSSAEWKYFKWKEAPKQKVTKVPLSKPDGTPSYPAEQLTYYTETWPKAEPEGEKKAGYSAASAATANLTQDYYSMLYRTLTQGKPLEITPQQVRRQIAVIEECHRQNPQIYGKKTAKK